MSELYHAKKKKKGLSGVVNNLGDLENGVNKARSIATYTKNSYEYSKKPKGGLPQLPNKSHNSGKLSSFANSIKNNAESLSINAKTNKAKVAYTSAKPVFNDVDEEDNPPKNLRRRLNHVQLKNIVGPKPKHHGG